MTDPVAIAKGLSEAQRRRLNMLRDVPVGQDRCRAFSGHGNTACVALVKLGLAQKVGEHGLGGAYQITPLGEQVRQSGEI